MGGRGLVAPLDPPLNYEWPCVFLHYGATEMAVAIITWYINMIDVLHLGMSGMDFWT